MCRMAVVYLVYAGAAAVSKQNLSNGADYDLKLENVFVEIKISLAFIGNLGVASNPVQGLKSCPRSLLTGRRGAIFGS